MIEAGETNALEYAVVHRTSPAQAYAMLIGKCRRGKGRVLPDDMPANFYVRKWEWRLRREFELWP
jgi:hypothetical protein